MFVEWKDMPLNVCLRAGIWTLSDGLGGGLGKPKYAIAECARKVSFSLIACKQTINKYNIFRLQSEYRHDMSITAQMRVAHNAFLTRRLTRRDRQASAIRRAIVTLPYLAVRRISTVLHRHRRLQHLPLAFLH